LVFCYVFLNVCAVSIAGESTVDGAQRGAPGKASAPGAVDLSSQMQTSIQESLQAALLNLAGKPVKEFVAVDFGGKLAELGLAQFMPVQVCGFIAGSGCRAHCVWGIRLGLR
jgi:hypothetical protein